LPVMTALSFGVQSAWSASLPAPVPRIIVSAASSWGTAADGWAGYTGQLNIWVPSDITGGWTLTFQSAELGKQVGSAAFWNTTASYDVASQTFTLVGPSWNGDIKANEILNIGFNGSGVLDTTFALSHCTLNGQPCAASVMTTQTAQQTLNNLQSTGVNESPSDTSAGTSPDPSKPNTTPPRLPMHRGARPLKFCSRSIAPGRVAMAAISRSRISRQMHFRRVRPVGRPRSSFRISPPPGMYSRAVHGIFRWPLRRTAQSH
jgi:hypothetical protein